MKERVQICAAMLVLLVAACVTAPAAPAQTHAAQQVYVITYKPGPAWQVGVPMNRQGLGPHAAYWTRLAREGRTIGAGPFSDSEGGLAIVDAANLDDARAIVAADPAVTSGIFVGEVHAWSPRIRGAGELPR